MEIGPAGAAGAPMAGAGACPPNAGAGAPPKRPPNGAGAGAEQNNPPVVAGTGVDPISPPLVEADAGAPNNPPPSPPNALGAGAPNAEAGACWPNADGAGEWVGVGGVSPPNNTPPEKALVVLSNGPLPEGAVVPAAEPKVVRNEHFDVLFQPFRKWIEQGVRIVITNRKQDEE